MQPITAILIGAGSRGMMEFGTFALRYPQYVKFVAVIDPDEWRRTEFASKHNIPENNCICDYKELAKREKFADVVVNTTPDTSVASLKALA